jgi:hypothetical protein
MKKIIHEIMEHHGQFHGPCMAMCMVKSYHAWQKDFWGFLPYMVHHMVFLWRFMVTQPIFDFENPVLILRLGVMKFSALSKMIYHMAYHMVFYV